MTRKTTSNARTDHDGHAQRLAEQRDGEIAGRGAIQEAITHQVQLGRASLPEEAANMVAFLASEAADYMCGQTIDVAGGQWMG